MGWGVGELGRSDMGRMVRMEVQGGSSPGDPGVGVQEGTRRAGAGSVPACGCCHGHFGGSRGVPVPAARGKKVTSGAGPGTRTVPACARSTGERGRAESCSVSSQVPTCDGNNPGLRRAGSAVTWGVPAARAGSDGSWG